MLATDLGTPDFVPNKGVPIFFSRPKAGLTNRAHVRHYDT
jgi:hypothetical protein